MQSSSIIGDIILLTILSGLFVVPILWVLWTAVKEYKKTQKGLKMGDKETTKDTIQSQLLSVKFFHFIGGMVMVAALFGSLFGDNAFVKPYAELANELGWVGKIIMFYVGALIYRMGNREFQKANKAQEKLVD